MRSFIALAGVRAAAAPAGTAAGLMLTDNVAHREPDEHEYNAADQYGC